MLFAGVKLRLTQQHRSTRFGFCLRGSGQQAYCCPLRRCWRERVLLQLSCVTRDRLDPRLRRFACLTSAAKLQDGKDERGIRLLCCVNPL